MKINLVLVFSLFITSLVSAEDRLEYQWRFNPVQGIVSDVERPYRDEVCLNGEWEFMPVYNAGREDFVFPDSFNWEQTRIKIPSPWNVNAFTDGHGGDFIAFPSYPEDWEKAKIGWMKKSVAVPSEWTGKRIFLHFEAVMGNSVIYVNGKKAGENFDLFLPFELDVTEYLIPGQVNDILVGVAKADLFDEPGKYGRRTYVGGSMWGKEMAGIWQDVSLLAYSPVYVSDVFIKPDTDNKELAVEIRISNCTPSDVAVDLSANVYKWYNMSGDSLKDIPEEKWELGKTPLLVFGGIKKIRIPSGSSVSVNLESPVNGELEYWTPDSPNLNGLVINLYEKKKVIDSKYERFGWRTFRIKGEGLYLNGERIRMNADSWHFLGVPQMTRRYAWSWYNMLKNNNMNAVRLHAQPYPSFYLDVADEMGICVLDETGIWSSDGGPKIDSEEYWNSCIEHIERLFERDKNHASVFGWSICNETIPVAVNLLKSPADLVGRQIAEINRWTALVKALDPTRDWISGDGEAGRETDLPTVIGHYGNEKTMEDWSSRGVPWGIGEQSMAYFGTPKQASVWNGDRSFESMAGRMEAVAMESYNLLKRQKELDASYCSIFNLAWYALKPLGLGMKDVHEIPDLEDGIFFSSYEEGSFGMQPERLGPFTTTFNPGYDPDLPLYDEWPLLEAVRNVNSVPMKPCPVWEYGHRSVSHEIPDTVESVLVFSEDKGLAEQLEISGVAVDMSDVASPSLVIVNMASFPESRSEKIKSIMMEGVPVIFIRIGKDNIDDLNRLLPHKLNLEDRKASSFLITKNIMETAGLSHADFYFSEFLDRGETAMNAGMSGLLIDQSEIIVRACRTDWQRWNYRPETSKTGNVYRSELEKKGSDVAVVHYVGDGMDIILSTLDFSEITTETQSLVIRLLNNSGVRTHKADLSAVAALDENLQLHRCMAYGPFDPDVPVKPYDVLSGNNGKICTGNRNASIRYNPDARNNRKTYFLSFRVFSPRSLKDLLIEPDMPSLDMYVSRQGNIEFFLNGIAVDRFETVSDNEVRYPDVLLEKGWNDILLKIEKGNDVRLRFESSDEKLKSGIMSGITD